MARVMDIPTQLWPIVLPKNHGQLNTLRFISASNKFQQSFRKIMFSHVMVGANDLEASRNFYDAVLNTLGIPAGVINNGTRYFYRTPKGSFSITKPLDGQAATPANGGTIGFLAETMEQVHAFHAAGIANGGTPCEDPPGTREGPFGSLNLAYLRDPTGNKICALHRPPKAA